MSICDQIIEEIIDEVSEASSLYREIFGNLFPSPSALAPAPAQNRLLFSDKEADSLVDLLFHRSAQSTSGQTIGQLKCLKQRKNDSCGYYVLYNSLVLLTASTLSGEKQREMLQLVRSRPLFWRFYRELLQYLVAHARELNHGWYPWNETTIRNGILERLHVEYLFGNHPIFKNLVFAPELHSHISMSSLSDFSKASLTNSPVDVKKLRELQEVMDRIRNEEFYSHSFLVGQTVHWIAIVITKWEDRLETIVCDSRNILVLDRTDRELEKTAWDIIERNNLHSLPEYRKKNWAISLQDVTFSSSTLHEAAKGALDLTNFIPKLFLDGFFRSYVEHVLAPSDPKFSASLDLDSLSRTFETATFNLPKLVEWLKEIYPPAVIEANVAASLTSIGLHNFPQEDLDRFRVWTRHLRNVLPVNRDTDDPKAELLTRFEQTIVWFETELQVNA